MACLFINPDLVKTLIVKEQHFRKYGYLLTFVKEVYKSRGTLDLALLDDYVNKKTSGLSILIDIVSNTFVIPNNFRLYENELIRLHNQEKKEKYLREKIYEEATKLYLGNISSKIFYKKIQELKERVDKIEWGKF